MQCISLVAFCFPFIFFLQQSAASSYLPVGCFSDRHRPLPVLLKNFRNMQTFDWKNFTKMIADCAELARKEGYMYFGLQYYGECWSGPESHLTFNRDGPSTRCIRRVGKGHANFVYRLTGEENECEEYKLLDSADRSRNHVTSGTPSCDHWNFNFRGNSWFRFDGQAGSAMANTCVKPKRCQSWMTGWMSGSHPEVRHGIQERLVCFSWRNKCCNRPSKIRVRNCGNFYVYYLPSTAGCFQRYCGNGENQSLITE